MEIVLLVIIVALGLLVVGLTVAIALVCSSAKGDRANLEEERKRMSEEREKWIRRTATETEYKALERQVGELRELKENLQGQVELRKVELGRAEAQITSINTQFKDLSEKQERATAQLVAIDKATQERCHGAAAEVERLKEGKMKEMEAELGKQAAEAKAELVKALTALEKELEERRKKSEELRKENEELKRLGNEFRELNFRIAAEHSEALKRLTLNEGAGGHIELGQTDRDEAALMRRTAKGMRCENAVLKATYDVYVKPEIERIIREQGVSGVSGIYRIWRKDGERELSYIGQAVDVGERWKTHAKRAWGVDNTGRIVLYQEMMRSGIENWHWELVEACQPSTSEASAEVSGSGAVGAFLSEREKYWGEFYSVKELGLNKKLG